LDWIVNAKPMVENMKKFKEEADTRAAIALILKQQM